MSLEIHVSADVRRGNDDHSGAASQPVATLSRARDLLRAQRERGEAATVLIEPGDYLLDAPLTLDAQDGGTADAPVTWRAAGPGVRLIGGRVIQADMLQPVTDQTVRSRLHADAREHVRRIDLRQLGVSEIAPMQSRGFGRQVVPSHPELFFDGEPMALARWPKADAEDAGFLHIAGFPEGAGRPDNHGGTHGDLEAGFFYEGDRPQQWADHRDVWVHGYWSWDWANSYERIETIDLDKRHIVTAGQHGLYGFRKGARFFFVNILEELSQPGEFYVDREQAVAYFWPPEDPADREIVISLLDEAMIQVKGASHLTLEGLTIEGTRHYGVHIEEGEGVRIERCRLLNIGSDAVRIVGGREHAVDSCEIAQPGDGGVTVNGGDRASLTPCHHRIHNNHMHHLARWSRCYRPAALMTGVGIHVTHNLIHDHPHCAILFNGNDHVIEFNEIHHVCTETGDVGAIYTGRDWTFCGNVIRHNFLHHIGSAGHGGSMAVYLDDCAGSTLIYGNVFYKTERAAFIGGGRDVIVENNIFVQCQPAVMIDGRGLNQQPAWKGNLQTCKDRLAEMPYHDEPWRSRYPHLLELDALLDDPRGVGPDNNRVLRNIVWGGDWMKVHWEADDSMVEARDNYAGDPGFPDREAMNFDFPMNHPVIQAMGIERIPFEKIGRLPDGA